MLDRLNGALEANGQLTIGERGDETTVIYPHKDFRCIMTVDAHSTKRLSRAMCNRAIEVRLYRAVAIIETLLAHRFTCSMLSMLGIATQVTRAPYCIGTFPSTRTALFCDN